MDGDDDTRRQLEQLEHLLPDELLILDNGKL